MFSRKKRARSEAEAPVPSASFPTVPFTPEHRAMLSEINSPWSEIVDPANKIIRRQEVSRKILSFATEAQIAEVVFVVSRPVAESKAVLARGRSHFTEAAMAYALKFVFRAGIKRIIAERAPLLVDKACRVAAESRSNPA